MGKCIVLHPGKCYKVIEVDPEIKFEKIKELVEGFVCVALRAPLSFFKVEAPTKPNNDIIVFCDEEGYMKHLDPCWVRPTDNHIVVGPVVFATFKRIWHDDGPDETYHPLEPQVFDALVRRLKTDFWCELILDETKEGMMFSGSEMGEA